MSENSGRYTCSVVNEVGAAMAMSHVTISSDNMGLNMSEVRNMIINREGQTIIVVLPLLLGYWKKFCLNHMVVGKNKV